MIYRNYHFIYDPNTGGIIHGRDKGWNVPKYSPCNPQPRTSGYLWVKFNGKNIHQQKIIWWVVFGEWPKDKIYHINGIKTDNRLCNLWDMSDIDTRGIVASTSGITGVSPDKKSGKWSAYINNNGHTNLGLFNTKEEAIAARKAAERLLGHGSRR